ncbi:MAG: redoxin domain-containing protein [Saprospiraceae bacterium]
MRILILIQLILGLLYIDCKEKDCPEVNQKFPNFSPMKWMQSSELTITNLKGKVVLLRWWTDNCSFCINTSESLNTWYSSYHSKGLEIIGLYHPKPKGRRPSTEEIKQYIIEKEFQFPIALDLNWRNLDRFWFNCGNKDFTSVSFLLDKKGVIRIIHPGGEYHEEVEEGHETCVRDYHQIDSTIRLLLSEE